MHIARCPIAGMCIELANAYSMLPYAFLAMMYKSVCVNVVFTIAWLASYSHHMHIALTGKTSAWLYNMDISFQILSNLAMCLHAPHSNKMVVTATFICLLGIHLTMLETRVARASTAGCAYVVTMVLCGLSDPVLTTNHVLAACMLCSTLGFLALSQLNGYFWCLGHLTILMYTVFVSRIFRMRAVV